MKKIIYILFFSLCFDKFVFSQQPFPNAAGGLMRGIEQGIRMGNMLKEREAMRGGEKSGLTKEMKEQYKKLDELIAKKEKLNKERGKILEDWDVTVSKLERKFEKEYVSQENMTKDEQRELYLIEEGNKEWITKFTPRFKKWESGMVSLNQETELWIMKQKFLEQQSTPHINTTPSSNLPSGSILDEPPQVPQKPVLDLFGNDSSPTKPNQQADELRFNQFENSWHYEKPDSELKFNAPEKRWEYVEPGEELKYNPMEKEWEYAK